MESPTSIFHGETPWMGEITSFLCVSGLAGGQPATTCGFEACSPASKRFVCTSIPARSGCRLKRKWSVDGMNPSKNAKKKKSIYTSKSIDAFSLPLQQTFSKRFLGFGHQPDPGHPGRRLDVRESFAEIRGTAVLRDHSAENLGVLRGL